MKVILEKDWKQITLNIYYKAGYIPDQGYYCQPGNSKYGCNYLITRPLLTPVLIKNCAEDCDILG